jgi:drug/metabolite transporter (DMT)-like permease
MRRLTLFFLVFQSVVFGTVFMLSKLVIPPLSSVAYLIIRFVFGSGVLLLIVLLQRRGAACLAFMRKNLKVLAEVSILYYAGSLYLLFAGTEFTSSTNQVILTNFSLVMVVIINRVFYKEKQPPTIIISVLLITLGIFLIVSPLNFEENPHLLGDLLTLSGVALGAVFTIRNKHVVEGNDSLFVSLSFNLFSAVVFVPLGLFTGAYAEIASMSVAQTWIAIYIGVGVAGLGYWMVSYMYTDVEVSPEVMGIFSSLIPIVGVIAGVTLLGETLTAHRVVGACLIIFSIYLSQFSGQSKKARAKKKALVTRIGSVE